MNTKEFLQLLLPASGYYFTASPLSGGKGWENTAHTDLDAAVAHINSLTFQRKAAYFALASYEHDQVWDAMWVNPKTKQVEGKWRQRTQDNAQFIRSFFLDLDVDPSDPLKFPSKEQAMLEFQQFAAKLFLPRPMIVDSGGGYHIYWPLKDPVPAKLWRAVADIFKAICIQLGFRADKSLTSDQARVLRALGSFNVRRDAIVQLLQETQPIDFSTFKGCIDVFVNTVGLSRAPKHPMDLGAAPVDQLGDNLGSTNDPLNMGAIAFQCRQVGFQLATRGAHAGEQLWRATLGIAKFCEPPVDAYRAVSDGHPDYDEPRTLAKMDNWRTGPTTCEHFHQENPLTCEGCPHWGKLTSPAQLGRIVVEAPTPVLEVVEATTGIVVEVKLPDPPPGYKRRKDGAILMATEDNDGNPIHELISPYDLYPTRIMRQSGHEANVDERSMWRAHLPRIGTQDMEVQQSLIADQRKLYSHLQSKGYILTPEQGKAIQLYMSAYLQKLAAEADREKLYERMGWHNERREFVLGEVVICADGQQHTHQPSPAILAATKNGGVRPVGTVDGWKRAMLFYGTPGYEGHRMFVYAALGAPLFHMNDTGNKGVLMTASGLSGRGKTTCLKVCSSVWGDPDALILNGNGDGSTVNALYESLGVFHSLPFLWDDITERDPEEIRRFLLNISQGSGKVRMADGKTMSNRRSQWETMVLATANTDDVSRILSTGKDVSPHLMRLVSVDFQLVDTGPEAKLRADQFLRDLKMNNGHVGPTMMKQVVQHYSAVRDGYIRNIAKVDRMLNSSNASAERYWSATVAAAYTGAQLARALDLLPPWPIDSDLAWMCAHLGRQRQTIAEAQGSPLDILSEFLETHIGNTLVLNAKAASNLDIIQSKPVHALLIRHEVDNGRLYVSRAAMMEYCTEAKTAFRKLEKDLTSAGVLLHHMKQKVLGADTPYAKGQTRCWELDARMLTPVTAAPTPPAAMAPSNVVPISGARAA